jgi:hypothetical protein
MPATLSQKNIYVILGVARSGTSAIARGLKALGIDLGDKINPGNEKWNAKGFWEDTDIVYKINGRAFTTLDFAPYGIEILDYAAQHSEQLQDVKASAIDLLQERFSNTTHWGFKDPSTVKLLKFWQGIFQELQINDHYVIALRNPLASAESYKKVTGSSLEIGLLLWLMHLLPAIEETHGKKRVIVSYDLLLQDARRQLDRIKHQLHVTMPVNSFEIDTYVHQFLDKKLHRFAHNEIDLKSHPATAITPLCIDAYNLFMRLAKDEIAFHDQEFLTCWQHIQTELQKIYPVYCYIDKLLKENNQLQKSLRNVHKSVLWKMLYPLRFVDDALRSNRHKQRNKRRLNKAYGSGV